MKRNFQFTLKFILTFSSWAFGNCAYSEVIDYVVKEGDTLSTVLYAHDAGPLYGKHGLVRLTKKLNPGAIKKSGNFVFVGQIIKLPIIARPQSNAIVSEVKPIISAVEPEKITVERAPSSISESMYAHFVYSPHLSFLKVESSNDINLGGSSVTALSQKGVGADVAWHVFYNDRFSFYGFGSIDYYSLYEDPNYVLNNSSFTRFNFGVGGSYDFSSTLKFNSKLSLRDVTFLDVITPVSVSVESMPVPEVEAGLKTTLFTKDQLMGFWGINLVGLLPSSRGSYKSKLGFGAGTSFELKFKNKVLFLNYDHRSFKVNEIENKESSIMLGISLIGEDDK